MTEAWPSPVGLSLGLLSVAVGQVAVVAYHWVRRTWCAPTRIQNELRPYEFSEGLRTHAAQPEGFVLLGAYLIGTWMFRCLPDSCGAVNQPKYLFYFIYFIYIMIYFNFILF